MKVLFQWDVALVLLLACIVGFFVSRAFATRYKAPRLCATPPSEQVEQAAELEELADAVQSLVDEALRVPVVELQEPAAGLTPDVQGRDELGELRALVEDLLAERDQLARDVRGARKRVEWLETELDLCAHPDGPVGRWLAMLGPEERPPAERLRRMSEAMRPYPVQLSYAEGQWLAERFELDDWSAWGPTVDEALIMFLGPARIAAQVPPERLAELRSEWSGEGLFANL